ncbi:Mpv17/PMP22 family protein [Candidatus Woesearchaeota archaeon]|nr:Mpv17/PMP22 family protein [Candidatus Woesearchaeota archaeon]
MPDDLENKLKEEPVQDSAKTENLEEKTQKGFLQVIKSFSAKDWLAIGASTAIGTLYGGGILNAGIGLITSALGYRWARKNKLQKKGLKAEMHRSNLMLPLYWNYLKFLNYAVPNLAARALIGVGLGNIIFTPFQWAYRHILHKYDMKSFFKNIFKIPGEVYRTIRNNFKEAYLRSLKFSLVQIPLGYLLFKYVPLQYQVPMYSTANMLTSTFRQKLEMEQAERKGVAGSNGYKTAGATA